MLLECEANLSRLLEWAVSITSEIYLWIDGIVGGSMVQSQLDSGCMEEYTE